MSKFAQGFQCWSKPVRLSIKGLCDLVQGAEPPSLFHYTNWDGLRRIVGDSCIWLTSTAKLNDPNERELGRRIAVQVLLEAQQSSPDQCIQSLLQLLHDQIVISDHWGRDYDMAYSVSFCGQRNDEHMFRSNYTSTGDGVCLKLSTNLLKSEFESYFCKPGSNQKISFLRMIYRSSEQLRLMRASVDKIIEAIPKFQTLAYHHNNENSYYENFVRTCRNQLLNVAVRFKDVSWESEKEWRLMPWQWSGPESIGISDRIYVRRSVPRLIVPLRDLSKLVEQIIIGPNRDFGKSRQELEQLFKDVSTPPRCVRSRVEL